MPMVEIRTAGSHVWRKEFDEIVGDFVLPVIMGWGPPGLYRGIVWGARRAGRLKAGRL
jgi:hypothetical protein